MGPRYSSRAARGCGWLRERVYSEHQKRRRPATRATASAARPGRHQVMVPVPKENVARYGFTSHRQSPMRFRLAPAVVHTGAHSQQGVSFGQRGVDAQGLLLRRAGQWDHLAGRPQGGLHGVVHTQYAIRERELRIELDGVFQQFLAPRKRFGGRSDQQVLAAPKKRLIGAQIWYMTPQRGAVQRKLDPESPRDGFRDLILYREQIRHLAIVTPRPEMKTIRRLDELRRDPEAAAHLANPPFENMFDVQPPANLRNFNVLTPEEEGGRAADDLHAGYPGQHIDDLLSQTIAENSVLFVRAHVGKR